MRRFTRPFFRGELIVLVIGILWATALAAFAFTEPLYLDGGTLVEVNGSRAAIAAGVPLVLSIATAVALGLRGRDTPAGPMAWTLAILCGLFSLVSILSIGFFIMPVVGCLIYACAVHGRGGPGEGLRWSMR